MGRIAQSFWLTLVVLAAAAAAPTLAQQEGEEEYKEPELVVRYYQVGDLIAEIPDFPGPEPLIRVADASGNLGLSQSVSTLYADSITTEVPESGTERLRSIIERTVRPGESWECEGGRSSLDFFEGGGKLIARTTERGHKELAALLTELRTPVPCVMIDVQVVELDAAFVADAQAKGKFVFKGSDELRVLQKATKTTCAQASVCATDRQRVWHAANGHHGYLSDLQPIVVAADGDEDDEDADEEKNSDDPPSAAVAYSKSVAYAVDGLVSHVMAVLSSDRSSARVDYRLQYSRLVSMKEATQTDPALPVVLTDDLNGTVRVPSGGAVLLASGRNAPTDASGTAQHYIISVHLLGD